jgi:hypothetical protein
MKPVTRASRSLTLAALAVVIAACTGTAAPSTPAGSMAAASQSGSPAGQGSSFQAILATSEVAVGPNRIPFVLVDPGTRAPIAAPDREATVRYSQAGGEPIDAGAATFVWAIEGERGIYVSYVDLPTAGEWSAEITTAGASGELEASTVPIAVAADRSAVAVGEPSPAPDTPTAADVGGDLSKLSTDADPLPAFYEKSVADARAAGEPFVLAFATPKFCTSAQCGPTLDRVKPFVDAYPSVTFINVEPYKLTLVEGQLQPDLASGQFQTVPAVDEFGIRSEPWIYVVDREGVVRGSYELIFGDEELRESLDQVK